LERTCKDHLVQPPCHWQGPISLYWVAQSPVQPDLEHYRLIHKSHSAEFNLHTDLLVSCVPSDAGTLRDQKLII